MSKLMHNVRAYTFWFLPFYISDYTTLNELLVVIIYIIVAVLLKFEKLLCTQQQLLLLPPASCISLHTKFHADGWKAVISDERRLKRWPPPSWIYYFSRLWSHDLFPVAFLQNFINLFQSAADLSCFVLKYKMVAIAMLNFIFVRFYGATTCRTSHLAHIWNFV